MKLHSPSRFCLETALILLIAVASSCAYADGQKPLVQPNPTPAPQHTESRPAVRPQQQLNNSRAPVASSSPHLGQWMENHKQLSLSEQQHALQSEPGFRELPPQVQRNQLTTLGRLYTMEPQQRSRMLNRVEGLERLNPQQQQQWSHAVQQLNIIPVPRRRLMARAIIDLREMPSDQRQQVIDSPAFGAQFSPEERQTIQTVLTAY